MRPYDPAYEESLRKKDVKAELPLNEKVLLDDSFIAPRYEITVKLRNGAKFEYWYTSKDNTYFAEGPKVNELYSMDAKQKNARNENPFATPGELGLPLAAQKFFALDAEESKDEVTSFPTKKYFLTVKSAEVESIIVDDMLSKKTTYSVK